ncbi:hypothetical protein StoSoilB5_48000 [Arthrobacter sp. StoSoilB5]|nr:hypothetical protein StoSoilB5_48000 [Arthrobacter sp. StoSoilB5]
MKPFRSSHARMSASGGGVFIEAYTVTDIQNNQGQEHFFHGYLVERSATPDKMRRRIHMGPPLPDYRVPVGSKAVPLFHVEEGFTGLIRKGREARLTRVERMREIGVRPAFEQGRELLP